MVIGVIVTVDARWYADKAIGATPVMLDSNSVEGDTGEEFKVEEVTQPEFTKATSLQSV